MSPSNTSKSLKGGSPTYQQMKHALFTVNNDNNVIDRNKTSQSISTENSDIESSSKSNLKTLCVLRESSMIEGHLNDESGVAPNPLLISRSQPEGSNQQNSTNSNGVELSKSGQSEGNSSRLSVLVDSGVSKPINPRSVTGLGKIETVAIESKTSLLDARLTPTADTSNINNSLAKKVPERISASTTTGKSKGTPRRRGKWTVEEEEYVARVIQDFNSGFLNAPAGYTLRSYLSDKLQCDPMRITKKFTGESCIGKRVFHPAVRSTANATAIDKAQVCLVLQTLSMT